MPRGTLAAVRRWAAKDDFPHSHDGALHAHSWGERRHRHDPIRGTVYARMGQREVMLAVARILIAFSVVGVLLSLLWLMGFRHVDNPPTPRPRPTASTIRG